MQCVYCNIVVKIFKKGIEDDGKVCHDGKLSTVNKLNGRELKIGDSHGVASENSGAESGVKEEWEKR